MRNTRALAVLAFAALLQTTAAFADMPPPWSHPRPEPPPPPPPEKRVDAPKPETSTPSPPTQTPPSR